MKFKKLLLFCAYVLINILFLLPGKNLLRAQNNSSAFSTFKIGMKFVANTNHNTFHHYWEQGYGVEGFGELPFYYGTIQMGIHFVPYNSKFSDVPDFQSRYFYLGWGKEWQLPFRIYWFNGIRVGSYQMIFDDDEINKTQVSESELSAGLNTRFSFPIYGKWLVSLSGTYMRIFTHKRVELAFISIGTSYSFTTPERIKDFLK